MQSAQNAPRRGPAVFGFPLRGFSLFSSLLLAFAASLFTFCATTCVAIFALLVWNIGGHHAVDYATSYRDIGLPASLIALGIALPFFGILWFRAKLHK